MEVDEGGWGCERDTLPPWKYPMLVCTLGLQHCPGTEGIQSFSSGRHWRLVVSEKARLMTAMKKIWQLSRMRHCLTAPTRRMKKRHIEILAMVDPIMNLGCPRKSNSSP